MNVILGFNRVIRVLAAGKTNLCQLANQFIKSPFSQLYDWRVRFLEQSRENTLYMFRKIQHEEVLLSHAYPLNIIEGKFRMINLRIGVKISLGARVGLCQLILGITLIEHFAMSWLVY